MSVMITEAPIYVSWNYTYGCNFNCSHCYSRAARYPRELSTSAYLTIVEDMVVSGVFRVGLGGGEPLIRRDCCEILARLGEAGVETNLTTNGWFVRDETIDRLSEARLSLLYVSLDSPWPEVHDRFRRKPGSHERVLETLDAAVRGGLRVRLSTVVTQVNIDDIEVFASIGERIGIDGIEFKRFRPAGNGAATRGDYSLAVRQEEDLRRRVAAVAEASPLDVQLVYGAEAEGPDLGCPCGVRSITLRPNGDVAPCAYSEQVIGNLVETPLRRLWQESPALQAMRRGGGCCALTVNRNPSNPALSLAPAS
jgi:MoaA/NifB/PqqE/SkfB family radical SAM enzyme